MTVPIHIHLHTNKPQTTETLPHGLIDEDLWWKETQKYNKRAGKQPEAKSMKLLPTHF
jgi:hypothetical protein